MDVVEVNVGSAGGKAAVDDIVKDLSARAFHARNKVIIFDEAHKLTPAAKDLLLKHMENCYGHVYLMFCTNQPDALRTAKTDEEDPFLDRCTHLKLMPVSRDETMDLLVNVSQFEGAQYDKDVLAYISEVVKGVPRKALNALGVVLAEGSWDLNTIKVLLGNTLIDEDDAEIIELSRKLFNKDFKTSCLLFSKLVKTYPVESIRIAVCGYFVAILKKTPQLPLSNALTKLTVPIHVTGKPAQHIFYNVMYQVVTLLGR